jgi:hypothetical protein
VYQGRVLPLPLPTALGHPADLGHAQLSSLVDDDVHLLQVLAALHRGESQEHLHLRKTCAVNPLEGTPRVLEAMERLYTHLVLMVRAQLLQSRHRRGSVFLCSEARPSLKAKLYYRNPKAA